MRTASRTVWSFVVATAIALGGCGGTQNRQSILPSAQIAAPVKLCTPAAPPADLLARPGFTQIAVSVTDPSGKPVRGLKQSDFEAHASGQILPINYFHEEPNGAPTSIVIVLDLSLSMATELVDRMSKIEAVQKSLPEAVNKLNGCDEIAILVFGGNEFADEQNIGQTLNPGPYQDIRATPIRLLQPFTTDHQLALTRVADRRAFGPAPLYDAIQQGLNMLQAAHYQNRALIVIADGVDTSSSTKTQDLITAITRSGAPIYAIELGEPNAPSFRYPPSIVIEPIPIPIKIGESTLIDTRVLEKLTAPNGGQLLIVPHAGYKADVTLKDELNSTVAALNHGYAIGVVAPAGSPLPEITVAKRPQIKVRAHAISGAQPNP
jgi:VWFA-related protein